MKRLDASQLGGHPLTLNDFAFLQNANIEAFKRTINAIVGNKPCILSGIIPEPPTNIGGSNFQWELSEGLYWDGEELLWHEVNYQITGPVSSGIWRLEKSVNNTVLPPLVYRNGLSKNVYLDSICVSNLNGSTGTVLNNIVRLDDELKARLGINAINLLLTTARGNIDNLVNAHNNQEIRLNAAEASLSNHLTPGVGGHRWFDISDKPYLYGSAYLGDIGVTSPSFPHVMGANCRRVAGTGSDSLYEIKIPNSIIIPGSYHVYGSIVGVKSGAGYGGVLWDDCNDITHCIVLKQNNQFHLAVRDLGSSVQDLWFEFMVVDMAKV